LRKVEKEGAEYVELTKRRVANAEEKMEQAIKAESEAVRTLKLEIADKTLKVEQLSQLVNSLLEHKKAGNAPLNYGGKNNF